MNGPTKKNMSTFDTAGRLKDHILPKIWICLIYILYILRISISAKKAEINESFSTLPTCELVLIFKM